MNMNDIFEYIPKVGDRVKIVGNLNFSFLAQFVGETGEVKQIDKNVGIAAVEIEPNIGDKNVVYVYFEDLQFIRRSDETKNHYICNLVNAKDETSEIIETEQEPVELNHLCMPTTQDEIEPIDKGEVVEEVGKFLKLLKSKGWSLDSLNLELCSKNDEEDYVIVNL